MEKTFVIHGQGHEIHARITANDVRHIRRLIVFGHGFGGHKDNRSAARFAQRVCSKHKDLGFLCFDWPCHGEDIKKKLQLDDCTAYLAQVLDYAREQWAPEEIDGYGNSFGGYLFLKTLSEQGNLFQLLVLRSPAILMHQILWDLMSEEEQEAISRGKSVLVGFDRKIRIEPTFLASLRAADLSKRDFRPFQDQLLIVHGTKDDVVPLSQVERFASDNQLLFFPVENGDHRFQDPGCMEQANQLILSFLEL